jgi:hypothetical protein
MQYACPLTSQCGLDRALTWLYGTAGLLIVVLLIVSAAALFYYLRNRRRGPMDQSGGPR